MDSNGVFFVKSLVLGFLGKKGIKMGFGVFGPE